jgi:hypothetical protein
MAILHFCLHNIFEEFDTPHITFMKSNNVNIKFIFQSFQLIV